MYSQQQSVAPRCNPQLTSSAAHMCVCACSSNWFGKVIERSKPSVDFCIDLYCYTQVCAHSSHWSASPRPGSEPLCWPKSSKGQHTCVCGQQQLVCQPLTLGCNRSSIRSAKVVECSKLSIHFFIDLVCYTHVCAHSSIWSASPRLG